MIKSGDIIKHKAFMDVAIQVITSLETPETGTTSIRGIWINQGNNKSYPLVNKQYPVGIPSSINIKKEDMSSWLKCNNSTVDCVRTEKWVNL